MPDCLHSQAPKDDELLGYALDGESLSRSAEAHILKCNSCRRQLESLTSTNAFLLRRLYRYQCPDMNILARYSAGLASLNEELFVLAHLASCPLCAQEIHEMHNILEDDLL